MSSISPCTFSGAVSCSRILELVSVHLFFVSCSSKMSKLRCLSIKPKNLILQEVDKGVKKKDIALKFRIPPNSLSTIIKYRDKLQNCDSSNTCSKHL
ncbi:tigger transposable element-derived protein 6 [Trichonephila clavipes]|nr:tigger transposable element-derived protein 6 [Trichonephila clavipes]